MKNIKQYFNDYPTADKVHQTSDGFLFHDKDYNDALNHAKTLTDKSVDPFFKKDFRDKPAEKENPESVQKDVPDTGAADDKKAVSTKKVAVKEAKKVAEKPTKTVAAKPVAKKAEDKKVAAVVNDTDPSKAD